MLSWHKRSLLIAPLSHKRSYRYSAAKPEPHDRKAFVPRFAANQLSLLVGEPTGGGGSIPGDQLSVELPNTRMLLFISYKYCEKPSTDGLKFPEVLPDYWVRQSLADYHADRDTALEFVTSMFKLV